MPGAWRRRASDDRRRKADDRPARAGASVDPPDGATPQPELTIVETRVYRGPNYWNYDPAIKLIVDLGVLEHFPSNTIPGFVTALLEMLPGVGQHTCGTGRPGGFTDRLHDGTWVGHVAEHIALQLQREAGTEVGRGKTRSTGEPGRYHVVYSYGEESVGLAAGQPRGAARQPPRRGRGRLRLRAPSSSSSSSSPSGRRSGRRPRRSSTRRRCATSRSIRLNDAVARPARPRHPPAAHPRHDDEPDRLARRRHRRRQEAHQPAAGRDRRARPPLGGGPRRGRRRSPRRRASASRWP